MMTLEAIYENGIFKPVSDAPLNFKEHEHVRIIIETETETETDTDTDTEDVLQAEFAQWDAASDEDLLKFEESLGARS